MKQALGRICLLGLLALSGCVVQSFHPFYSETSVVTPANVAGQWQSAGQDAPQKPWRFTPTKAGSFEVLAYDKDLAGQLTATFFQIGTNLFCDFVADSPPEQQPINGYWLFHVQPVHTVSLVQTGQDQLVFIPLSRSWLLQALRDKTLELPRLQGKEPQNLLMTATAAQWAPVLAQQAGNTNAFAPTEAVRFGRVGTR